MKIILRDSYKSLKPFESEELTDFVIITGKNGSGKTQLLNLIYGKHTNDPNVNTIRLDIAPNVSRIQFEGITKESSSQMDYNLWRQLLDRNLNLFRGFKENTKALISYILTKFPKFSLSQLDGKSMLSDDSVYINLLKKTMIEFQRSVQDHQFGPYYQDEMLRMIFFNAGMIKLIKELSLATEKNIQDLEDMDFYTTSIKESVVDSDELFSSQIETIFFNYAKRRDKNRRDFFHQKEDGEKNEAISDQDFVKKFIPPWSIINGILDKQGLDFLFKEIDKTKFSPELKMDFRLVKKSVDKTIEFNELSSGEKIIIGLVIKLFTSEYYSEELTFPDLIILDEPDAYLHPEMSKLLIDVLEDTFVRKFGIKVLFSTHSPSTIALAPEKAIFQLTNHPSTELKKIKKDDALKILTSFVPTLSIDYKNHRQVFVESPTDVLYYQTAYDKHAQNTKLDYKLYFISNVRGKGNCEHVYKIVGDIRGAGNITSYGIVDWDLINTAKDNIYVHGLNERYSMENFLLDPIYLITLLLQSNAASQIAIKMGLKVEENEYLIGQKTNEELQSIVDAFFEEVATQFPSWKVSTSTAKTEINYFNKKKIFWPNWYCIEKGHNIETKLKIAFPALNKYKNEGEIQQDLTTIMAKSYPFVPSATIKILEELAIYN
jgi:ABC-type transport system involved in cytochrome c biogenesis ATPase subunit